MKNIAYTRLLSKTAGTLILGLALVCGVKSAAALTLDEIKARGYMTVATEDDFSPFEFFKDGKAQGFDHDVIAELKKYAPFQIRQEILPWTGLLPGVTTGKFDMAISGVIVSEERLKVFDFAPPIASGMHYAIVRAKDSNMKDVKDLSGLTVGVQAGSALLSRMPELEAMLKKTGGKLGKVVQYQSYPDAYADLASGRVDYVINTVINARALVKERPKLFALGMPVSGDGFHAWPVTKGNASLLQFMTGFVDHLRTTGKLQELQKKWFGDAPALPTVPLKTVEQYHQLTITK